MYQEQSVDNGINHSDRAAYDISRGEFQSTYDYSDINMVCRANSIDSELTNGEAWEDMHNSG